MSRFKVMLGAHANQPDVAAIILDTAEPHGVHSGAPWVPGNHRVVALCFNADEAQRIADFLEPPTTLEEPPQSEPQPEGPLPPEGEPAEGNVAT